MGPHAAARPRPRHGHWQQCAAVLLTMARGAVGKTDRLPVPAARDRLGHSSTRSKRSSSNASLTTADIRAAAQAAARAASVSASTLVSVPSPISLIPAVWVVLMFFATTLLVGGATFTLGFFPSPVARAGVASAQDDVPQAFSHAQHGPGELPDPQVQRVVLMVVDAMRSDFVFGAAGKHMPFLSHLIADNSTHAYAARTHAPTVTLPRIKALMSGAASNYLDVVRNFDSSALRDDSLIAQLRAAGRRLIFYGDDTWLRVFPDAFMRSEGTTSFFVSDTVEVDANVTRHLDRELPRDDWDFMVLHYLGLDHIGHLQGPDSALVPGKLAELDAVVQRVWHALQAHDDAARVAAMAQHGSSAGVVPSLLLLASDHGMNDLGNHGGSSDSETSSVLVFASSAWANGNGAPPLLHDAGVAQVDVVPTLAMLLGVPVPRNNIGKLILPLFQRQSPAALLRCLQINAEQVARLLRAAGTAPALQPLLDKAHARHTAWLARSSEAGAVATINATVAAYMTFLEEAGEAVAAQATQYDVFALSVATVVLAVAAVASASVLSGMQLVGGDHIDVLSEQTPVIAGTVTGAVALLLYGMSCASVAKHSAMCTTGLGIGLGVGSIACVMVSSLLLGDLASTTVRRRFSLVLDNSPPPLHTFIVFGSAVAVAGLAGSSTVEEEHQTWYFLSQSMLLMFLRESCSVSKPWWHRWALGDAMLLLRLARTWNQTGNRWLGSPDTHKWLVAHPLPRLLLVLASVVVTAALSCLYLHRRLRLRKRVITRAFALVWTLLQLTAAGLVIAFHVSWHVTGAPSVPLVRAVYAAVAVLLIASLSAPLINRRCVDWHYPLDVVPLLLLFSLPPAVFVLHRVANVPLLAMLFGISACFALVVIEDRSTPLWVILLASSWLSHAFWWMLGNSNALATIDFGTATLPLASYSPIPAGLLTLLLVYTGPVIVALLDFVAIASFAERPFRASPSASRDDDPTDDTPDSMQLRPLWAVVSLRLRWGVCILIGVSVTLRLVTVAFFSVTCIVLRHHLFVWSVFSPKYLYELAWTMLLDAKVGFLLFWAAFVLRTHCAAGALSASYTPLPTRSPALSPPADLRARFKSPPTPVPVAVALRPQPPTPPPTPPQLAQEDRSSCVTSSSSLTSATTATTTGAAGSPGGGHSS